MYKMKQSSPPTYNRTHFLAVVQQFCHPCDKLSKPGVGNQYQLSVGPFRSLVHEYTRSAKNNTYSIPFSAENGIRWNTYVFHSCLRDEIGKAADPAALIRKLGADGTDSEEEALFKKVADRVAKTELELATYQQREGIFTKANVVSNAKAMAPAKWWATYCKHLALCAWAAGLCLCSRAQLVRLWPDQDDDSQPHGAHRLRQARLLPQGPAPQGETHQGGLQGEGGEVGLWL